MKIVIFGNGHFASLAWHVITHDSPHEVVGFTVDRAFIKEQSLHDLPVAAFEGIEHSFPPNSVGMLTALGPLQLNKLRRDRYLTGKAKGYRFVSYVSTKALTWSNLTAGENCMIYDGAMIQPFVKIGSGVIVRNGANISHHVTIGDYCFISGAACIGGGVTIGEQCFLGLNSTIMHGIRIAPLCTIGAGAVVTKDIQEGGTYMGVPAKRIEKETFYQPSD